MQISSLIVKYKSWHTVVQTACVVHNHPVHVYSLNIYFYGFVNINSKICIFSNLQKHVICK